MWYHYLILLVGIAWAVSLVYAVVNAPKTTGMNVAHIVVGLVVAGLIYWGYSGIRTTA